jgi:16S rRNA (guanine527-N7)-methyltransferase
MRDKIIEILRDPRLNLSESADLESVAEQIQTYLREWKRWNAKINLTAEQDEISVVRKHFFDSLLYALVLDEAQTVIDIGSGAGFPGLPLKMVFPEISLTLVESQRKRANFLKDVSRALQFSNIQILNLRAEDLQMKSQFDLALFRYVGSLEECLRLGEPLLRPGGRIILIKEPEFEASAAKTNSSLQLQKEVAVVGYSGISSKLLIFAKCST